QRAKQHRRGVGQQRRDEEAGDRDRGQAPVVEDHVQEHQPEADRAGQQAAGQLVTAEGRGDDGDLGDVEPQRQRTVVQDSGQVVRVGLREGAGDLRLAAGDGALVDRGGRLDHAVEHDRELPAAALAGVLLVELLGGGGELAGALRVEVQVDLPVAGHRLTGHHRGGAGALDVGAGDLGRTEQVLGDVVLVAGGHVVARQRVGCGLGCGVGGRLVRAVEGRERGRGLALRGGGGRVGRGGGARGRGGGRLGRARGGSRGAGTGTGGVLERGQLLGLPGSFGAGGRGRLGRGGGRRLSRRGGRGRGAAGRGRRRGRARHGARGRRLDHRPEVQQRHLADLVDQGPRVVARDLHLDGVRTLLGDLRL